MNFLHKSNINTGIGNLFLTHKGKQVLLWPLNDTFTKNSLQEELYLFAEQVLVLKEHPERERFFKEVGFDIKKFDFDLYYSKSLELVEEAVKQSEPEAFILYVKKIKESFVSYWTRKKEEGLA